MLDNERNELSISIKSVSIIIKISNLEIIVQNRKVEKKTKQFMLKNIYLSISIGVSISGCTEKTNIKTEYYQICYDCENLNRNLIESVCST